MSKQGEWDREEEKANSWVCYWGYPMGNDGSILSEPSESVPVCLRMGPWRMEDFIYLLTSHSYWSCRLPGASTNFTLHHSQDAFVCVVSEDLTPPLHSRKAHKMHTVDIWARAVWDYRVSPCSASWRQRQTEGNDVAWRGAPGIYSYGPWLWSENQHLWDRPHGHNRCTWACILTE